MLDLVVDNHGRLDACDAFDLRKKGVLDGAPSVFPATDRYPRNAKLFAESFARPTAPSAEFL